MSDQAQDIREDISFMRSLAEEGRRGPILGGAFLAAAGLIYGAAAFVQWAVETSRLGLSGVSISQIWIGASIVFALVWFALFFRLRQGGQRPGANQYAFGMAWAGCGAGIVVLIAAIAITAARLHQPEIQTANGLVAFAFYGTAWMVSGAMARQKWMFLAAAAAFAMTLLVALLSNTTAQLLVFGAGLMLSLTLPGLQLMRQAAR
jgi:hypothetical protein